MTADSTFLLESWPSLKKAYEWCLSTDDDGDGLMDNRLAGLGALEFGALTGIQTDIYLGAVWIRATYAMQFLATAAGETTLAGNATLHYRRALDAFEQFWDEESGQYTYAFSSDGETVKEVTPWGAVGLMWGFGIPDRSSRSIKRMNTSALTTDWGIRMMSDQSTYYEPLNYNYGAVWPFLTSWVSTAQFKHHFVHQGYSSLMNTAQHVFQRGLGHVTEVFSGATFTWPQESVAHQGFCTAGTVLPFVRGLLGLEGSALERRIDFEPRFPADWDHVTIKDYVLGDTPFSFEYECEEGKMRVRVTSPRRSSYRLQYAPVLGAGTRIIGATVNGQSVPVEVASTKRSVQPSISFNLTGSDIVEIEFEPTVELIPPVWYSQLGNTNEGIKIISLETEGPKTTLIVEGRTGYTYIIPLRHYKRMVSISGAVVDSEQLEVHMPDGPPGQFVRHIIQWETSDS